jgi:oxalate decarboxylase/phosphoglucose isomerase-like protein (cupin superfamily)
MDSTEALTLQSVPVVHGYQEYQAREGVPSIGGFFVEDLRALELAPWSRKGGRGCFINLDGTGGTNDAYVMEIAPGGSLNPQKQMFEEMIFILEGNGSTTVWQEGRPRISFEWQKGSLFAIPLNAWHQHFNGSGVTPVRYVAVTNAPLIMDLFHNLKFIFEDPFVFDDRFGSEDRYFSETGTFFKDREFRPQVVLETNFVPDVYSIQLHELSGRGAGGRNCLFELAGNCMAAHVSEFPVGTYKKAHRHGPGAHVTILSGQGYSLLWPAGEQPRRVDWQPGCVVVPPSGWFHQHFNTGPEPARYLALRWGSRRFVVGADIANSDGQDVDVREGGSQIEYDAEDPQIHEMFEEALAQTGAPCHMKSMVPSCSAS